MRVGALVLSMVLLGACGASPTAEPVAPAAPAETAASATTGPNTSPPVTTVMHGDTVPPSAPSSIPDVAPGVPQRIDCTTYYRPLGDAGIEGAVEETLTLDTGSGEMVATSDIHFPTMSFRASWLDEDQSVLLAVTTADESQLTSVLYQAAGVDLTAIQFVGGHGFTGLHYVDHEGAQLQFSCTAT